ncbi:MAG: hypothetical protein QM803_09395 [Rhodocyclaceae bacterium]
MTTPTLDELFEALLDDELDATELLDDELTATTLLDDELDADETLDELELTAAPSLLPPPPPPQALNTAMAAARATRFPPRMKRHLSCLIHLKLIV